MKSQIKALAADEGKFFFASCIYVLIFPEFLNLNFKLLFYSVIGPRNLKKKKKKLDDVYACTSLV
jgi:hypothetical protein